MQEEYVEVVPVLDLGMTHPKLGQRCADIPDLQGMLLGRIWQAGPFLNLLLTIMSVYPQVYSPVRLSTTLDFPLTRLLQLLPTPHHR